MFDKASCKHLPDLALLDPQKLSCFSSTDESYCVVLRCFSIFPTLPGLQAKDRRKSTCVSEMFALKLGN